MKNICGTFLCAAGLALGLCSCGGGGAMQNTSVGSAPVNSPVSSGVPAPQFAHVILVVEENHSYNDIIGNGNMPYINGLASQYAVAAQYFADAHSSLLDYFMLTAGGTIATDDSFTGPVTQDTVVRALKSAGKSWRCYAEGLPSTGYTGADAGPYVKHHNPFAYFADVLNDPAEAGNMVPFVQFASDVSSAALPDYSFVVPNVNNDAHDCPVSGSNCADNDKLVKADQWLQANIDPLVKSSSFQDSLLIITFDEGDSTDNAHGGGQVATLIVSPKAKAGYKSSNLYQHESTLRLTMEALGVSDLPGVAAKAPEMGEFFK